MKGEVLLMAHVALGDMLLANGLIRWLLANRFDKPLVVLHKAEYRLDAEWMYHREITEGRIRLHQIGGRRIYDEAIVLPGSQEWAEVLDIGGFSGTNRGWGANRAFDLDMYLLAGVPHDQKYASFHVERHPQEIVPHDCPYALIHDDPKREMKIRPERIEFEGLKLHVRGFNAKTIFRLRSVIENATEIHCIDSAISNYADLLPGVAGRKFLHRYARKTDHEPAYRDDWEVLG